MSIYCIGIVTSSGLPLFTRQRGGPQLPFSSIASLNGVNMYSKCHDIVLKNTKTQNGVVLWKEFYDSITLIGIANGGLESDLEALLVSVFNAMVMFVGIDELKNPRNPERLKRDLRPCYPLIDRLMESLDSQSASAIHPTLLLNFIECILCPEVQTLQNVLDQFTVKMGSVFGCLCVHGRYVCGTLGWKSLSSHERRLLLRYISLDTEASLRDTPMYLCHRSPNVPFRVVICKLLSDVHVLVICGPTPALSEVDEIVLNSWQQHSEILKMARQRYPRNFPPNLEFPSGVLGVMVVNLEEQKYVISRNVQSTSGRRALSGAHRLDILRTFFLKAVQDYCKLKEEIPVTEIPTAETAVQEDDPEEEVPLMETYWCSEYHKCHAYKSDDNICCVLYASIVPMPTMRLISKKILEEILNNKNIYW